MSKHFFMGSLETHGTVGWSASSDFFEALFTVTTGLVGEDFLEQGLEKNAVIGRWDIIL